MTKLNSKKPKEDYAKIILSGLGSKENIKFLTNCLTRLRVTLKDVSKLDKDLLINETGATKIFVDCNDVQVVYGIHIEKIRQALDKEIKNELEEEGYIGNINIRAIIDGIGGKENIKEITNCMTRLRLVLDDVSKVDENTLINKTKASKVIIIDQHNVHIIYGLKIEKIRKAIEDELNK